MPIYRMAEGGKFTLFEKKPFRDIERVLEDWIERNPHLIFAGEPLAVFGRQVGTAHGKLLDLLAVDQQGACVVIELKRGQTPREVVAQVLEYSAWVDSLSLEQLDEVAKEYFGRRGKGVGGLVDVYDEAFGGRQSDEDEEPVDDPSAAPGSRVTFNHRQRLVIVAESFTPEVEQTLRYLRTKAGLDVTGVRFSIHEAGPETLLDTDVVVGREPATAAASKSPSSPGRPDTHEETIDRVRDEFLKNAVNEVEDWLLAHQDPMLRIEHGVGSYHAVYYGTNRILGYYFANQWMFCWLGHPSREEERILREGLTKPSEVVRKRQAVRFHVVQESDLDLVKAILSQRLAGTSVGRLSGATVDSS